MKSLEEITVSPDASQEVLLDRLKTDGVLLINNYLDRDRVAKIVEEVYTLLDIQGNGYAFGRVCSIQPSQDAIGTPIPNIQEELTQVWMKQLAEKYLGSPIKFNQAWFMTHDYRNDNGMGRQGWLHFDRNHTFKYFLYLSDMDRSSGAFRCWPGTHVLGKELREAEHKKNKEYTDLRNRLEIDYPELGYKADDSLSIDASEGSLAIFDTDTFHLGGLLEDKKERLVIRSHHRRN